MKLGFMASGRGSNMQSILTACDAGQLQAEPILVISNNPDAAALEKAEQVGMRTFCFNSSTHPKSEELDQIITQTMQENNIELIILAGYMRKIGPQLLAAFPEQIINIHPALLPKFGGQGMYGMYVHRAVIEAKESQSGATVHLVNEQYDQGRILAQQLLQVDENDTAETLAAKVLKIEHQIYPQTIQAIINGEIKLS